MKLLIEIPKEAKQAFDCAESNDLKASYYDLGGVIGVAIKNGKPLNAVLDEIKAEFKSKADGDDWYHTTDGLVWEEAIEIIDKYKEGESEEEKKHDKEATPTDATL